MVVVQGQQAPARPRARELGIAPGAMETGPLNAITDVGGVLVGHSTIVQGDTVRTGVTAVLPHGGNLFREKVPGGVFVGNAFGKLAGSTQVEELGTIESPIVLTNTLSVGTAVDAVVRWSIAQVGNENVRSVNALVGETNDGRLNDIRGFHVTRRPRAVARSQPPGPARSRKGPSAPARGRLRSGGKAASAPRLAGSSSRTTRGPSASSCRANYGGRLVVDGVPVWKGLSPRETAPPSPDGSCMIVVATDAPLDARNLERLAARAVFALARTGSTYSNGSGDFAIAFSTHPVAARREHDRTAAADDPADRRRVGTLRSGARFDRRSGLQLDAEGHGHDRQRPDRPRACRSTRSGRC